MGKYFDCARGSVKLLGVFASYVLTLSLLIGCGAAGGESEDPAMSEDPVIKEDIEMVVGYSPGGGFDIWARLTAPFLEEHLPDDVNVVIRNVPGASGQTAANQLYVAEPDGSRIDILNLGGLAAAQLTGGLNFDLGELTYLGTVNVDPYVLAVAADSDIESVEDLKGGAPVSQALTGFSSGDGVTTAIVYEAMGIEYSPVLHEGQEEARLSVVRGDTDAIFSPLESLIPEFESGDLKPILWVSEEENKPEQGEPAYEEVKDVQTVAEAGYTELSTGLDLLRVFAGPPGLPDDVKQVLSQALQDAIEDPEFAQQAEENKIEPDPANADETSELVDETLDLFSDYEDVLKKAVESG